MSRACQPSRSNEDPFDANGFALPLFNAPQPSSVPRITTDLASDSPYDTLSSARFPPPSANSGHQHRHSISNSFASTFSPSSPHTAGPPPADRHQRQGSMSSALPYTNNHSGQGVPYPQSGRTDGMMMVPPHAGGVSSLGSLARSASLGRKKDPYSYSSDDVESGLGNMDMGAEPTWPGYGGRSSQQSLPPPMPQSSRDVVMSPNRPSSNNPMNPPPVPPHALSRPPQQRYDSDGSSASGQYSSQAHRESFSNPYVPRGAETGSDVHNGQWTDYRRPPSNRMPSASSYSAQSPASDQQQHSSPYLRPDMLGTSPSSPMPNPYELSPNTSNTNLPSSPLHGSQWSTLDTSMPHSPSFSRSVSHQAYPASQPTTPAKGYEGGAYRPPSQNKEERSRINVPSMGFKDVRDKRDLKPNTRGLNQGRRADPNAPGKYLSPLKCLTTALPETYSLCNPAFRYETTDNPRRVLTKPSKPTHNDGADNEDWDYILYVNDVLGGEGGRDRYLILDVLGQGTFGQVVKCQNMRNHEIVAVKVVKNKPAYLNQSKMEVAILDLLNREYDPNDIHHILRMLDSFTHKNHLCLVFECLSSNLYELIKQNQFKGLSTQLVKVFTQQLLESLAVLKDARLIHCDLKPENILLKSLQSPEIKIIDFGSACHEMQTVYTYIQSRFYRSPEVLLGLPYSMSIDMWSLGCIVVELYLGLPLFPGTSEYNQLSRIVDMMGLPPTHLLDMGKQTNEFFNVTGVDAYGKKIYALKPMEQYATEHRTKEQPSKQYFKQTKLREIIMEYPISKRSAKTDIEKETANRRAFVDFVEGLLNLDPIQRWTPQQAAKHPFITGEKFKGSYQPSSAMSKKPHQNPETPTPLTVVPTTPTSGSTNTPKKYGGLVQSPNASRTQRIYSDAAAYNQQLNQHQSYTAQVQSANAVRHQPFGQGYDAPPQQPTQPSYTHRIPSQSHSRPAGNSGQWPQPMAPPPQPNFNQQRIPSQGLPSSVSHSTARNNQSMVPAQTNPPPNSYYPQSRNRANTINQMDAIPPALARLTHFGAPDPSGQRNLTPVLNRDDAYREWERRQAGHSRKSSMANASYPQLEYLQEQAELAAMGGQGWMLPGPYGPPTGHHLGHGHTMSTGGSHYQMQPHIGSSPQHHPSSNDYRRATGPSEYDPPLPTSSSSRSYLPTYPPPAATSAPNSAGFDGFDSRDPSLGMLYTPLQPSQPSYPAYGHGHGQRASYSGPYHLGQQAALNNPFAPHQQGQQPASPRYQRRSQGYGA